MLTVAPQPTHLQTPVSLLSTGKPVGHVRGFFTTRHDFSTSLPPGAAYWLRLGASREDGMTRAEPQKGQAALDLLGTLLIPGACRHAVACRPGGPSRLLVK